MEVSYNYFKIKSIIYLLLQIHSKVCVFCIAFLNRVYFVECVVLFNAFWNTEVGVLVFMSSVIVQLTMNNVQNVKRVNFSQLSLDEKLRIKNNGRPSPAIN